MATYINSLAEADIDNYATHAGWLLYFRLRSFWFVVLLTLSVQVQLSPELLTAQC